MGWLPNCCGCPCVPCADGDYPETIDATVAVTGANPPGRGSNCCADIADSFTLEYKTHCKQEYGPTFSCAREYWFSYPNCSTTACNDHCGIDAWRLRIWCVPSFYDDKSGWTTPWWEVDLRAIACAARCPAFQGGCRDLCSSYAIFYFSSGTLYSAPDCNFSNYPLTFHGYADPAYYTYCDADSGCQHTGGTAILNPP